MIYIRLLGLITLLFALTACAVPDVPPTPDLPQTATGVPTLPSAAVARPTEPPTADSPSHTPVIIPTPSAAPAPLATAAPEGLALPTATPPFPTQAIDEGTLASLRPLRVLGLGAPQSIALTPDGSLLAVATGAGVALFELPSLRQIRFDPIEGGAQSVAFSADSQTLVVDGVDGRAELRRVSDGIVLRTVEGVAPVFSPDGRTIATMLPSRESPQIALWRVTDGQQLMKIAGADPVFSPDGRLVATVQRTDGEPDTIGLWNTADNAPIWSMPGGRMAFSPDGQLLASATQDTIQLLRLADNHPAGTFTTGAAQPVYALAFSLDSAQLRVLVGGELQIWSLAEGRIARTIPDAHPESAVVGGLLGPGGELLMSAYSLGDGGFIRLARAADGATIYRGDWSGNLSFSADRTTAAALHLDIAGGGMVRVLDVSGGSAASLALPKYTNVSFSPDAQTLAASTGYTVELRSATDNALQRTLQVSDPSIGEPFSALRFSPDGTALALNGRWQVWYGESGFVAMGWDLQTGDTAAWERSFAPGFEPSAWAVEPSGMTARSENQKIEIYPSADITLSLTLPVTVTAMTFNPEGTLLAVGDEDGAVHLIKTSDGTIAGILEAGDAIDPAAKLMSFSPDGTLLGALRSDGVILVWNVDSRLPLAKLPASPSDRRLLFTADGLMAIAGGPRGVAFYRLSDGKLLRTLPVAAEDIAIGPRRRLLALLHSGQIQLWGTE
jgi:WD40 repeat protein